MIIGKYEIISMSMPLPAKIKAMVCHNNDETYTVVVNDKYSYETQMDALLHELKHITSRDYEKDNAEEIEIAVREKSTEDTNYGIENIKSEYKENI